ncbi:MAG: hypothetical protein ACK5QZ_06970 [Bacteroidota bacterium]|jgi:hypothetical protein
MYLYNLNNNYRKKILRQTIAAIENNYPANDFIISYADFLKNRDYVGHCQFNPKLYENMLRLTYYAWKSKKRISRLSLLQKLKEYYHGGLKSKPKEYLRTDKAVTEQSGKLLFGIFRKTFEESAYILANQLEQAQSISNNLLINMEIPASGIEWLCSHAEESKLILNRVLRYPVKSDDISSWAKANYTNNAFRNRRAELISWIIDKDPLFEIDEQTMIEDFTFISKSNINAIVEYNTVLEANEIIMKDLGDVLKRKGNNSFLNQYTEEWQINLERPNLHLYDTPHGSSAQHIPGGLMAVPEYEELEADFYSKRQHLMRKTMIWAITYSRIDNHHKFILLKKYYDGRTFPSLLISGKKTKNVELLKWILNLQ